MVAPDKKEHARRIGALLGIYGSLLTAKQRDYTRMHYQEQKRYSAIARESGVSRQSIYDTIRQAVSALENYEANLGLLARGENVQNELSSIPHKFPHRLIKTDDIRTSLEDIQRRIRHERVLYNTDWLLRELNSIISKLK